MHPSECTPLTSTPEPPPRFPGRSKTRGTARRTNRRRQWSTAAPISSVAPLLRRRGFSADSGLPRLPLRRAPSSSQSPCGSNNSPGPLQTRGKKSQVEKREGPMDIGALLVGQKKGGPPLLSPSSTPPHPGATYPTLPCCQPQTAARRPFGPPSRPPRAPRFPLPHAPPPRGPHCRCTPVVAPLGPRSARKRVSGGSGTRAATRGGRPPSDPSTRAGGPQPVHASRATPHGGPTSPIRQRVILLARPRPHTNRGEGGGGTRGAVTRPPVRSPTHSVPATLALRAGGPGSGAPRLPNRRAPRPLPTPPLRPPGARTSQPYSVLSTRRVRINGGRRKKGRKKRK